LLQSVGPGADPGVQAFSPQMTLSHPPSGRLPLLSTRPAVTLPAKEHRPDPRAEVGKEVRVSVGVRVHVGPVEFKLKGS